MESHLQKADTREDKVEDCACDGTAKNQVTLAPYGQRKVFQFSKEFYGKQSSANEINFTGLLLEEAALI